MSNSDHICAACGKPVDPAEESVVLAIEQIPAPGGDLPELRLFADGEGRYCHEDHVPRSGLYRVVPPESQEVARAGSAD